MTGITKKKSRREFLRDVVRVGAGLALAAVAAGAIHKARSRKNVWQIDPAKCTQCGRCASECVLSVSAVKCVHRYAMCGYCKLCFGYFQPGAKALNKGAENQTCPTGAIRRTYVEDPYFQYSIDEDLCIGCAKCVKGCGSFGNGSLFLQIRHDRCLNCNECSIAVRCPSKAISRVTSDEPYKLKG